MDPLIEMITPVVENAGAKLYDTEIAQEHGETIYRISITKEGGVDVDTCASISRQLSPLLDVHPPVGGEYRLEVSSPGIERRLRTPAHYESAVGESVKLTLKNGFVLKGKLLAFDGENVTIEVKGEAEVHPLAEVSKGRTRFEW